MKIVKRIKIEWSLIKELVLYPIWWSITNRCIRCGKPRYKNPPTVLCEYHYLEREIYK
jgi:hypothetical protein